MDSINKVHKCDNIWRSGNQKQTTLNSLVWLLRLPQQLPIYKNKNNPKRVLQDTLQNKLLPTCKQIPISWSNLTSLDKTENNTILDNIAKPMIIRPQSN